MVKSKRRNTIVLENKRINLNNQTIEFRERLKEWIFIWDPNEAILKRTAEKKYVSKHSLTRLKVFPTKSIIKLLEKGSKYRISRTIIKNFGTKKAILFTSELIKI